MGKGGLAGRVRKGRERSKKKKINLLLQWFSAILVPATDKGLQLGRDGVNMFANPGISLYVSSSLPREGAHKDTEA